MDNAVDKILDALKSCAPAAQEGFQKAVEYYAASAQARAAIFVILAICLAGAARWLLKEVHAEIAKDENADVMGGFCLGMVLILAALAMLGAGINEIPTILHPEGAMIMDLLQKVAK